MVNVSPPQYDVSSLLLCYNSVCVNPDLRTGGLDKGLQRAKMTDTHLGEMVHTRVKGVSQKATEALERRSGARPLVYLPHACLSLQNKLLYLASLP